MGASLARIRDRVGLRGGVGALAAALLVLGFGQELWAKYLPEYLRQLGASAFLVGVFGSLQDTLDAAGAYPGGRLADRIGSRPALRLFAAVTTVGIGIYLVAPSVAGLFAGALLVSTWRSLGLPATFTLIGEELAGHRRVVGFTVQSVVKRIPIVIAPPLGGLLLQRLGFENGMRMGFAVSIVLSLPILAALSGGRRPAGAPAPGPVSPARSKNATLPPALRRLLVADCFARLCEGLPAVFLVLWAFETARVTPFQFGILQSILTGTAILSYLPAAALARRAARKPFVVLTFLFFALFPLAVFLSRDFAHLAAAYVVGGLREIGEPARKALILDLAGTRAPGRAVGLYYTIRGFAVAGAAAAGGALWTIRPALTFAAATLCGAAGVAWAIVSLPRTVAPEAAS